MNKYFITGVPGIGKTSVVNELRKRGVSAFDLDETEGMCHWINLKTGAHVEFIPGASPEWLAQHGWACRIDKLKGVMEGQSGDKLFVSGVTSNQNDYLDLFDKIFLLQAKKEVFISRMAGRSDQDFGYNKSDRQSVLGWYKQFEEELISNGAISIDATKSTPEVVDEILTHLD